MAELEITKSLGSLPEGLSGNILKFRMEQHPINGLEIFMKSVPLERIFSNLSAGVSQPWIEGHRIYAIPREKLPTLEGFSFDFPKNGLLVPTQGVAIVNLTILRVVGLGSGVKFKFNSPMGQKDFKLFRKRLEEGVCSLYNTYMRPRFFSLEITSKEG